MLQAQNILKPYLFSCRDHEHLKCRKKIVIIFSVFTYVSIRITWCCRTCWTSIQAMTWCLLSTKPLPWPKPQQHWFWGIAWTQPDLLSIHYSDVTMGMMASQITSLTIVYSTVYSGADQRKHQSSASLAFVRGIHRGTVNSPHKWPVTRKMFPFDDVVMWNPKNKIQCDFHWNTKVFSQ